MSSVKDDWEYFVRLLQHGGTKNAKCLAIYPDDRTEIVSVDVYKTPKNRDAAKKYFIVDSKRQLDKLFTGITGWTYITYALGGEIERSREGV